MRKLVLGALLLGSLAMASGCIITSDDDNEPGGYFTMQWVLTAGSSEVACADVGAGGVSSLATLAGTSQGVEDIFTCEDGQGTTGFLPEGTYTVVVSILEEGTDAALGVSMPKTADIIDTQTTDLGAFNFSFAANGNIDFTVDYGGAIGTNCDAVPTGEGVLYERLTLDGGGQCLSTELLVDGVSDVTDICATDAACVELAVPQTLVDVPPGDYTLTIDGIVGGDVTCFTTDVSVSVDGDVDLGDVNVPQDTTVCT